MDQMKYTSISSDSVDSHYRDGALEVNRHQLGNWNIIFDANNLPPVRVDSSKAVIVGGVAIIGAGYLLYKAIEYLEDEFDKSINKKTEDSGSEEEEEGEEGQGEETTGDGGFWDPTGRGASSPWGRPIWW